MKETRSEQIHHNLWSLPMIRHRAFLLVVVIVVIIPNTLRSSSYKNGTGIPENLQGKIRLRQSPAKRRHVSAEEEKAPTA
ncbi:Hypothetical protein PHPALM_2734 [Phytophthora palmivora]|uniref:Uncharacterized protein n=1 Tax=Phytophthora palmivora TaxID=4796 RepID=A0A2P4YP18_9STRA|nr:Hypothetical protein PHPALM_2734 [Phytophthora palmivora]